MSRGLPDGCDSCRLDDKGVLLQGLRHVLLASLVASPGFLEVVYDMLLAFASQLE